MQQMSQRERFMTYTRLNMVFDELREIVGCNSCTGGEGDCPLFNGYLYSDRCYVNEFEQMVHESLLGKGEVSSRWWEWDALPSCEYCHAQMDDLYLSGVRVAGETQLWCNDCKNEHAVLCPECEENVVDWGFDYDAGMCQECAVRREATKRD